ncbi:MAG: hypothetical protein IBX58_14430 [Roseovarius sp.]|nr:hypothetical protein [Roseovarius sp.]
MNRQPIKKYIRLENDRMIVFPRDIEHRHVAEQQPWRTISAGFLDPEYMVCFGESMSLGIGGLPDDTEILRRIGQEQAVA